jgi:hypothetical protein
MLTEEIMNVTGARLECSPPISLTPLAEKTGL